MTPLPTGASGAPLPRSCDAEAGRKMPVVDRNRCEGKADCVRVCPFGVFELRRLTDEQRAGLSFLGRLKVRVRGGTQAFADVAHCHSCGLCVSACPEKAIKLVAVA